MIRLNIVALLILAAIGWAIDGFVEAATPMTPQRNMEAANELLRIVKPGLVQELTLEPRKPASKPSVIYWPENVTETEDVRLIVNFNDEYQVRLDSTGQVFSNSGRNIESLAIILDGLNVSLKPVFDVPEEQINTLLRRAEQTSGKVQPDLAGNYFVIGSPMDLEKAGMVLLHDPRVETAVFDKTEDPRKAVAMQKQARLGANPAISSSLANNQTVFTDSWLPNAPESTNFGSIQEETYDIQGQLVSRKSKRVGTDNDWENRDGQPATLGACCVSLDNYDQTVWPGPMLGGPSPTLDNPQVISFCRPNLNSQDCVELYEGVFLKLGVCDAINVNATVNLANCQNEVDVAGSCCIAGDVEVLTAAECIDGDGLFMHTYFSRFDALAYGNFPNVNVNSTPPFNQQLNTQLLAHAYGLTNFIWENVGGPFGPTSPPGSVFNSNYSYWGLFGMGPASPFGFGGGIVPFESSNGDFNNTSNNYNINITSGGLAGFWAGNPGSYRMGLIDFQTHDAAGNPTGVVATTTPGGNVVTGGFTFGTSSNATGVIYNPNIILATANDSLCEFGICAVDCWDGPGSANPNAEFCETASASSRDLQALTPILGPEIIAPTGVIQTFFGPQEVGNVRCSSWVYELSCNQMAGRSTFDSYNPTGSLWQDILGPTGVPNDPTTWRPEPENPILAGCQTPNPDPDDDDLTWWKDYQSGTDNLCCFGDNSVPYTTAPCAYEEFVVEEEANALRGDCFFSNANYPTMFVNQGGEQILGLLGCYGDGVCAIYCNDQETSDDICALAPICCDEARCDDEYARVSGWSFICADLVNQRSPFAPFYIPGLDIDLTGQVMTDFDQNIRLGGPYPEFNPLNLVTPVLRNADGSVQDQNPATPVIEPRVLPSPNSCRIAYGVQNQCYTPYFSEYQPSLGLASGLNLPAFDQFPPLNGGCSDFECCHRVCSIDPAQTNYDYGTCCTVAWTEECVDKAQEICYTNQGGVVSTVTPDFSPLQNHLSQKTGRGPRPLSTLQYQNGMRRLAPAPQQAPSVISPTTLPTQPADNWLQSLYSVQWVSNPLGTALTTLALPSVNGPAGGPGIAGGLQWQADPITGEFTPLIQQINDPNNWNDFYYGEVPSRPIPWWGGEGLSLYGNIPGQGWPQDPSYLTYSLGLYSWGQYIAQQRPGFHPWGPYVNGTAGAGLNIAVLDTSAWLQEYINDAGILVGAVHEDLGNILLEGPVIGAAPVQMMFDPFVNQPQRGTAVLGTIAAAVDGVGTDGIAPNALTFFYPTQSVAEGNREELAWFAALVRLKAGDVLVATYQAAALEQAARIAS